MERRSNKRFFVMQQKVDRLKGRSYVLVMQCRKVTVKIQAGCCRMKVRNVLTQPEQNDAAREDGFP